MKTIKKRSRTQFMLAILLGVLMLGGCKSYETFTTNPDRKTMRELNRSIRRESRNLNSAGYRVEVGALPMEMQLRRSYEFELQHDELGRRKFVIGVGSAVGGIENAARMHAVSDAAANVATLIEAKVMGLIEQDYQNRLFSHDEYLTLSQMQGAFSMIMAQSLPTGVPVAAFVKDHSRHYEYQVRVAYPMDVVHRNAAAAASKLLQNEARELREKMERVTGLDKLLE